MNERWTRGIRHAVLFLLVPALGACAVGRLSDRIVIDAATQVTGDDFLTTGELAEGKGLKLQRGDILTYTRWSPGFATPGGVKKRHLSEPTTDHYRILVRHVEPDGRLNTEEERLLAAALTVQRLDWDLPAYNTASRDRVTFFTDLQAALFRHQARLWNALIDTMVLQRIGGDSASGMSIVPVLRVESLCSALASDPAALETFARAFIDPREGADCTPPEKLVSRELTFMGSAGLKSLLHAAASFAPPEKKPQDYYFAGIEPFAHFNFASLERNGVQLARRDVPEADWTLREWEKAKICRYGSGSEAIIRRIRLAGGRRKLWISRDPDARPATYSVSKIFTEKESSRSISRVSHGSFFEERAILAESDLEELRMSDVDFVEWGRSDRPLLRGDSQVRVKPDGCYFPGTL